MFFGIIAWFCCTILNIGIFKDYAFLDANEFVWTADNDENFKDQFIQGGRFLYALLNEYVYGVFTNSISSLKWIRFFSLTASVGFSVQLFLFLLKLNLKTLESALFAFLVLMLPSFSIYHSWSATYEVPIALNLSFFAGLLIIKAIENRKKRNQNYLIAFALVIISLCLYQSAVTILLIPFVFKSIIVRKAELKHIIILLVFLAFSFLTYFIIFKLSLYWFKIEPNRRTGINVLNFPYRIIKFYLKELRMVIMGSGFLVFPILSLSLGLISVFGFFYTLFKKQIRKLEAQVLLGFLVLVLPLSYFPNLISSDSFICSRTIAPTAIIVLFFQFMCIRQIAHNNKIIKGLSITVAILFIALGSLNLNYYVTRIHNKEYIALKKAFEKIPLDNKQDIVIVRPKNIFLQEYNFYKQESADEFGHISSSRIWVPEPLFKQILTERFNSLNIKNSFNYNIEVKEIGEKYDINNSIEINLVEILKKEFKAN